MNALNLLPAKPVIPGMPLSGRAKISMIQRNLANNISKKYNSIGTEAIF